jgi:hypothetical protein
MGSAGLLAVLCMASAGGAFAKPSSVVQREWQADVRIQSLEAAEARGTGGLSIRIKVGTEGSDAAKSVHVEVLLPLGVGVTRVSESCHPSASPIPGLSARVTCDLGDVTSGHERELGIVTSARNASSLRFAAFAFSDTPDPVPANNFMEKTLQ